MSSILENPDTTDPIYIIKALLRDQEVFTYRFIDDEKRIHEITIKIIWDFDAEDFANDFLVLQKTYARLTIPEFIKQLRKLLEILLARIQRKRQQKNRSGYVITETIITDTVVENMVIPISPTGKPYLDKVTVQTNSDQVSQSISLNQAAVNCAIISVLSTFDINSLPFSNAEPPTSTDQLLSELLAILETREQILNLATTANQKKNIRN